MVGAGRDGYAKGGGHRYVRRPPLLAGSCGLFLLPGNKPPRSIHGACPLDRCSPQASRVSLVSRCRGRGCVCPVLLRRRRTASCGPGSCLLVEIPEIDRDRMISL